MNSNKVLSNAVGPWSMAWDRFKKNKISIVGGIIILIILLFSYIGPFFSPYPLNAIDVALRFKAPSFSHPFGTDRLGQDMMVRLMVGGRLSILLATMSATITLVTGAIIGAISGYFGGLVDKVLMRFTEFIFVLPLLPMIIAFSAVIGFKFPVELRMTLTMAIFGFLNYPTMERLVRGQILSLRHSEFMNAAKLLGVSKFSKIFKHLLPNVFGIIIASSATIIASAILIELTLSFVGMGFPPEIPTWGNMISNIPGLSMLSNRSYWLWFYSVSLLGEGLRDALDPKFEGK